MSARIALVDTQRRIQVIQDGASKLVSEPDLALGWGSWGQPAGIPPRHAWPTWSPDGRRLAFFRVGPDDQTRVRICEVDGVTDVDLFELRGQVPVYLQWAPTGAHLAVVSQHGARLDLHVAPTDGNGEGKRVASGAPLFFNWSGPERLVAFVAGGSVDAHLIELHAISDGPTVELPGRPGNFCVPLVIGERVFYVSIGPAGPVLVSATPGQRSTRALDPVIGLAALVPSPSGAYIARSCAANGEGAVYRGIGIIKSTGDEVIELTEMDCLAFFWTPDERALVVASQDPDRGLIEWHYVALDGERWHLADMLPSRDMAFYLRFFEQYAVSHPIIDPTSTEILLGGKVIGQGEHKESRVYRVPLQGGKPELVGEGAFAVWSPS